MVTFRAVFRQGDVVCDVYETNTQRVSEYQAFKVLMQRVHEASDLYLGHEFSVHIERK